MRRTRRWTWIAAGLCLAATQLPVAATQSPAPGPLQFEGRNLRYVFTDREAFLLMPPELVAAPLVRSAQWSPDNRYVLAERERLQFGRLTGPPTGGEVSLVLWSAKSGRPVEIWKQAFGTYTIEQTVWLHGADAALAIVRWTPPLPAPDQPPPEPKRLLLRIDAAHSAARPAAEVEGSEELTVSPTQPVAILRARVVRLETRGDATEAHATYALRTVLADGKVSPPVALPEGVEISFTSWSPDGKTLALCSVRQSPQNRRQLIERWWSFAPLSGRISELPKKPATYDPPVPDLPFALKSTPNAVREAESAQPIHPIWIESPVKSERPRALLVADATLTAPASDGSAVLYVTDGAAWVVPVDRRPKAEVEAAIRAALQQQAMSNAKQIGLSLAMYAQDYDENFPANDGNVNEALLPYLRSRGVFSNPATGQPDFNYTYQGGSLSSIENPAETVLGYLGGPGGRAVIYADGHVKWESSP